MPSKWLTELCSISSKEMGNQAHFPFWWVSDSLLICLLKELFGQLLMQEHDSEWWSLGSRTGLHSASPLNRWIICLPSLLSVKSCTQLWFLPVLILPRQDSWGADEQEGVLWHRILKKKKKRERPSAFCSPKSRNWKLEHLVPSVSGFSCDCVTNEGFVSVLKHGLP